MVYIGSTDEKSPFVYTSAFFDETLIIYMLYICMHVSLKVYFPTTNGSLLSIFVLFYCIYYLKKCCLEEKECTNNYILTFFVILTFREDWLRMNCPETRCERTCNICIHDKLMIRLKPN